MWWFIGGAIYLFLLALGLLFLHGASKLEDPAPPGRDFVDLWMREQDSQESPRQLLLPFAPSRQPALSYTRAGLAAAIIQKISGLFSQLPGL
jgi:hypothetical protein